MRRALLAVLVGVSACGRDALPDPAQLGFDVAAARAFQEDEDKTLAQPVSPLSAVDAFYLEAGETLALGIVGDQVVVNPTPAASVQLVVSESEGAIGVQRTGLPQERSRESLTATLGRFELAIGPQSGGVRVVVHDRTAEALTGFTARPWFDVSAAYIVGARLARDPTSAAVTLPTTRGLTKALPRAGTVALELGGKPVVLTVFESGPSTFLLPFTDATTGTQTYPVGRYVVVDAPTSGDAVVIDFNRATNPWCAYSEHYNCPIPPTDNGIATPILAGERWQGVH